MLVDGKAIAQKIEEEIRTEVAARKRPPVLSIIMVGNNPVSDKYLAMKSRFGDRVGISVEETRLLPYIDQTELIAEIKQQAQGRNKGVVVQLPLPPKFDTEKVLQAISPAHDPDLLSNEAMRLFYAGETALVPPVTGAFKEILMHHSVFVGNKNVVIIGKGKLVGAPAATWFKRHGGMVQDIDKNTPNVNEIIATADIIVSGVGQPGIITPKMVKTGVVILDAGTTESNGSLKGDADPDCAAKASVFTPVPGGVGPVTIAVLFQNLLKLTQPPKVKEK